MVFSSHLIQQSLPVWQAEASPKLLEKLFAEHVGFTQFPVLDKGNFVGFVHRSHFSAYPTAPSLDYVAAGSKVYDHQHLYHVLKISAQHQGAYVAVLNKTEEYLGSITLENMLQAITQELSLETHGQLMLLTVTKQQYNLQEIIYLLDSEKAQLIGLQVQEEEDLVKISLHLHTTGSYQAITDTLRRFNYQVHFEHDKQWVSSETEQRNLNLLMKYLKI